MLKDKAERRSFSPPIMIKARTATRFIIIIIISPDDHAS